MISTITLTELREDFATSSFAVWSDRFPRRDCIEASDDPQELVEFIEDRADELRPEVVLVGLNPSTDLPGDFSNFHSTEARHQDIWLRVFVEEAGLDGAYMTDLAEQVEPRAMNVDIRDASLAGLAEQLRRLGETEYVVIAFGRDAFRALQSVGPTGYEERDDGILVSDLTLVGIPIELYGVYHYSQVHPDNVRRLRDQLGHLGREVLGS